MEPVQKGCLSCSDIVCGAVTELEMSSRRCTWASSCNTRALFRPVQEAENRGLYLVKSRSAGWLAGSTRFVAVGSEAKDSRSQG